MSSSVLMIEWPGSEAAFFPSINSLWRAYLIGILVDSKLREEGEEGARMRAGGRSNPHE
jgi:predicted alpha-1,6-mannanase (GH76 family)